MTEIKLIIKPREEMTWKQFIKETPEYSIALDGIVTGGPNFDEKSKHVNFDHHGLKLPREALMSTAKQVYFAIKGNLFKLFQNDGIPKANIYINDTDQDTMLGVYQLMNHKGFEGIQSNAQFNRLLDLTDKLDITGGAFPMNLDEKLVSQHNWIFEPYTKLRQTGELNKATEDILRDNVEAMTLRINKFLLGQGGKKPLDTRHKIIYNSPKFVMIDEIGGNEARYYLFSKGMDAYISIVGNMPGGRRNITVGRSSKYVPFDVPGLVNHYNKNEDMENPWGGSSLVAGCRNVGTSFSNQKIIDLTNEYLDRK
ncbi:hypothetical protein K9L67_01640 [Candidatus Woesearchaeota archaeon]|nr:hypothetical protein [Candidatus Woesearchaeota archaeon]MCF7900906.1 hypothetical protein [Candidatus Woesearchaeota archaeon]MCF8013045.1 hypothetical protein [Candidatus Woesearchaeota archaeon]